MVYFKVKHLAPSDSANNWWSWELVFNPKHSASKACTLQLSVEPLERKLHLYPVPLFYKDQYSVFKGPEIKYHYYFSL